jgi:hypothetical protein
MAGEKLQIPGNDQELDSKTQLGFLILEFDPSLKFEG